MSDIPGGGAVDRSRPDDEPTINAAGADGFLVDGTDSFAVPGPIDVVPAEDVPESPAVSRTRVLVTAGAVAAGLAFVIAVGRGGAGDAGSSLRADGAEAPGFAFSNWGADAGDVVVVVPQPADEDTLRRLEDGEVASGRQPGHDELGRDRRRGPHGRRRVRHVRRVDPVVPGVRRRDVRRRRRRLPVVPTHPAAPHDLAPAPPGDPVAAGDHAGGGDHDDAGARTGGRDDHHHGATGGGDDDHVVHGGGNHHHRRPTTLFRSPTQATTTTTSCVATTTTIVSTSTTEPGSTTVSPTTTTTVQTTTTTTQPGTTTTGPATTTSTTAPCG